MKERAPIITLVGSTKFKELWYDVAGILYQEGAIVLTTHVFSHADGFELSADKQREYDAKYLQQIDMSDAILVLNKDGYIGLSACNEILYAMAHKKSVFFMYPLPDMGEHGFIDLFLAEDNTLQELHIYYDDDCEFYGWCYRVGYTADSKNRIELSQLINRMR